MPGDFRQAILHCKSLKQNHAGGLSCFSEDEDELAMSSDTPTKLVPGWEI